MTKRAFEIPADHPMFSSTHSGYEHYGYSPAVRAGNLLYIAGEVGFRPDGSIPESVAEQAELSLERTKEILRLNGLAMRDLVEVVSYHVQLKDTIDDFLSVKARYTERPFPAWSIIGVEALALPQLKIEIRSIAVFPDE
ncbi:Rid family hydrolase [Stenotrophomonas lactitubi]|uniref:Rid family hydrolase n=1 Tax=Stenotrophomonas lactitubi TaxID=2045214 RepID=UPI0033413846